MNLLTDPLFRIETPDGPDCVDLPGLLAQLGADRVDALTALQRHQEDAFHIFLCYLAGAVLARLGNDDPVQDADYWRTGIRELTRQDGCDNDNAWTLIVEDPTEPAFMQVRTDTAERFSASIKTRKAATPDELDVLVTAKNHDVKKSRVSSHDQEAWVYALINVQTTTCYLGSGNYGVSRSSGGTGPRVRLQVTASARLGGQWRTDTSRLLGYRGKLLNGPWGYAPDGLALTWLPAWNLDSSLASTALDPFFLEISRGYRVVREVDGRFAVRSGKTAPRVLTKSMRDELSGRLGDPWTPIDLTKNAALNVQAGGFSPSRLRDLLFCESDAEPKFEPGAFQKPEPGRKGRVYFLASALARRGKDSQTEGLEQVFLRIPDKATRALFSRASERDRLAELSQTAIADSGAMQNRVLKPAVFTLLEAAPEKLDFDKREVGDWWERTQRGFQADWSADFFPWLWRTAEHSDSDTARIDWLRALAEKAESALELAIAGYPRRTGRRFRAEVQARGLFHYKLGQQFEALKPNEGDRLHGDAITD